MEWLEKMKNAGLKKNEILNNPSNMISIIQNYETGVFRMTRKTLPTDEEFHKCILEIEFFESDPSKKYKFTEQLGSGAMCKVYKAFDRETKDNVAVRIMRLSDD